MFKLEWNNIHISTKRGDEPDFNIFFKYSVEKFIKQRRIVSYSNL